MSYILDNAALYNQAVRLSAGERANPRQVLEDFKTDYTLNELRDILREISETCLTANSAPFDSGQKRADFIYFMGKQELLYEAIYMLGQQSNDASVDGNSDDS